MSDCIDNLQSQIDELKSMGASRGRKSSSNSSRSRSTSSGSERKAGRKSGSKTPSSAN